jgi:hypothetical protein
LLTIEVNPLSDLCLADSLVRASSLASTTIDASISVDGINITLRDSLYRAFTNTRTASNTLVGSNYTCHSFEIVVKKKLINSTTYQVLSDYT